MHEHKWQWITAHIAESERYMSVHAYAVRACECGEADLITVPRGETPSQEERTVRDEEARKARNAKMREYNARRKAMREAGAA